METHTCLDFEASHSFMLRMLSAHLRSDRALRIYLLDEIGTCPRCWCRVLEAAIRSVAEGLLFHQSDCGPAVEAVLNALQRHAGLADVSSVDDDMQGMSYEGIE